MITVAKRQIRVDTRTLIAVFESGALISLVRKSDKRRLIAAKASGQFSPLQLVFPNNELASLSGNPGDCVTVVRLNDCRAQFRFESWHGDGILDIQEDALSGEVVVEPSAYSSRPGLVACRWNISGIDRALELVAPFFQGIRLSLEDSLIHNTRWHWPHLWEASLAILQGRDGGFSIHSQDTQYRYKALQVGTPGNAYCIGLDSEEYGPIDGNLGAGGIAWRVNVHSGGWEIPAGRYRDWLSSAWAIGKAERPQWVHGLRFAISWCPTNANILKALAKRLDPRKVLLHVPDWRQDKYDEGYPRYAASRAGAAFVRKAQAMGFHAMPHFNSIDMDPTHPAYTYLRDFQYRDLISKSVQGWTWTKLHLPVPESNSARLKHRSEKTMVKIHPGLAMWRSILAENVLAAAEALSLDAVFLDVTLCTWNLHNCLVENETPSEGMCRLIEAVRGLGKGLAVGGEGRNETTFRGESFGQVHLFKSWGRTNFEGLERAGGTPLCEFLFGRTCRSFGYTGLSGRNRDEEVRMKLHVSLGAMPTVTIRSEAEIENPNKMVKEMLRLANE
jgi:hypothetical protein